MKVKGLLREFYGPHNICLIWWIPVSWHTIFICSVVCYSYGTRCLYAWSFGIYCSIHSSTFHVIVCTGIWIINDNSNHKIQIHTKHLINDTEIIPESPLKACGANGNIWCCQLNTPLSFQIVAFILPEEENQKFWVLWSTEGINRAKLNIYSPFTRNLTHCPFRIWVRFGNGILDEQVNFCLNRFCQMFARPAS